MKLTNGRLKEIDSLCFDILTDAYGAKHSVAPPINLKKILEKYGVSLNVGDFKDPSILGAYDKEKKAIYVAEGERYTRKAFTIAHELGHFFLHDEKETEFFYRTDILKMEQDKLEETEANKFAASLLMPKGMVQRLWPQFKSIGMIARIFKVSHTTARYRLLNLGLTK